jgi:hypothetical protein
MTRTPLTLVLAAAAALAGCSKEDHNIVAGGPLPDENAPASNAGVQLPPSIVASKIYRCADNQIVYVDWLSDNKSAHVRTDKDGSPTNVTAVEPGKPMAGPAGYSLEGSATSGSARIGLPGHPAQSCKA